MNLPPLDTHAHVIPAISAGQLDELQAVVIAVTRSDREFAAINERHHPSTAWGLGCHPGLVGVQKAFNESRFNDLMLQTAVLGEVGLDGQSRVPMEKQREVFDSILKLVAANPRMVTIHSYQATEEVLQHLENRPISSAILHWWLGDESQTLRAVQLGCYFSVNFAQAKKGALKGVPVERLLMETDHPFGDRWSYPPRRPGGILPAEQIAARFYGVTSEALRRQVWLNFGRLVDQTKIVELLPQNMKHLLGSLPPGPSAPRN